jgi:murein hydrolase activator
MIVVYMGVFGCALMTASPVNAQVKSRINNAIDALRRKYENLTQQYEEGERALEEIEERKRSILDDLDRQEREMSSLRRNLNKITSEGKRLDSEIRSAHSRYEETRSDLNERSESYGQRIRSLYMRQKVTPFQMLASAGSVSAAFRGLRQFAALARHDISVLTSIRETQQSLEAYLDRITLSRKSQQKLERQKRREESSLKQTTEERTKILAEVSSDAEMRLAAQIRLQHTMEEMEKEIARRIQEANKVVQSRTFVISEQVKNYNITGRKGSLPWPVEGKVVTGFGLLTDPRTKTKTRSRGIEIATSHGDNVSSAGAGIVVITDSIRGYGNYVVVYHPPNIYTLYGHLADIYVTQYTEVAEGGLIGLAGSTGLIDDSESRLLFEILNGKIPEDPRSWLK